MHNGDTSFWRNPWKINEPVPGGTSLSSLLPRPFSLPHPFHSLVPISLTAARRHSAPCGGCGKNPRRTRINAIMNLSRWDLTIQDVATTPPPRHPPSATTSSATTRIYTKTNFAFLRPERSGDGDNFACVFFHSFRLFRLGQLLFYIYIYIFSVFQNYFIMDVKKKIENLLKKDDTPIIIFLSQ